MSRICLLSLAALLACAHAHEGLSDPEGKPNRQAGDEDAAIVVTGELGNPLHVNCLASQYPTLFVFWYRGHRKDKLLYNDSEYGLRGNVLLIRNLTIETLGQYTCQAYDAEGMVAPRMLVVRAYMPDEVFIANEWLVPRDTATTPEALGQLFTDELKMVAFEGGIATLRCSSDVPWSHGNQPPKITWKFGELTIDGNASRYRLTSHGALQIVPLYRNDTGVYICVADNGLEMASQKIHLAVNDSARLPAGIAGDENATVTGELGRLLHVRCLAYGYPPPFVYWYRGYEEDMVLYNNAEYETRGNDFIFRNLSIDTLGQYTCRAYNGVGKVASWGLVVRAYKPEGLFIEHKWLVPRTTVAPINTTTTTTTTTTEAPRPLFTAAGRENDGFCRSSLYGCCQDHKTPAHGPDFEGCCLLQPFGCCPDNRKPADGAHLEGCGCQYALHGCCADNVTMAQGPDNQGCGCLYSQHGCCPDRHTTASGSNYEGCACNTYQFGCCADGVTTAKGPEQQGCHCRESKYGCCGDGETHATGPDAAGCDCSSSRHGCCPDGHTEATGPKFLGCTDAPENKQASCSMSPDAGPCHNFTAAWYFYLEYGGCSRFWYGGCDGNGNRFATKEHCEDVCVQPSSKDVCMLPSVMGPCSNDFQRWYYDSTQEKCIIFRYGGCLGNANNFGSRELCKKQCEPSSVTGQCNLPIDQGSCAGNYSRWGFNSEAHRCEQFIWGGCEGNSNRFSTEAACQMRCAGTQKPQCTQPQDAGNCTEKEALWSFSQLENRCLPFYYSGCGGNDNQFSSRESCEQTCPIIYVPDKCTLPAEIGECSNYRERWFYDTTFKRCRQFYYGGCGGNENNFGTEAECDNSCAEIKITITTAMTTNNTTARPVEPQPEPRPAEPEQRPAAPERAGRSGEPMVICQLPMLQGPCEDSLMRWFYDPTTDSCTQFTYGGCEGNDNRFASLEACESRCSTGPAPVEPTTPTTTVIVDGPSECRVPEALEDCRYSGLVWFFDPSRHECVSHANQEAGPVCRYTGTFLSQEACERSCGAFRGVDVCKESKDPGLCQSYVTKVYFDQSTGQCREFIYGGCLGGANRFSSIEECSQVCKDEIDPCTLPPEEGSCFLYVQQWYYDPARDQCNQFVYTGCSGNDNRFETQRDCEARCKRPSPTTTTVATPPQQLSEPECRTPSSLAPCGNNVTVFYYDSERRECLLSGFGGCDHPNMYRTEEECERGCGAFRGIDVCGARLDPGPCRASINKIYWDTLSGSCQPYVYGGCAGGPNRFSNVEECMSVCGDTGLARACLQEVHTGHSCEAVPAPRYHYSVAHVDCVVFAYLGCGGNDNNFRSYAECADVCRVSRTRGDDVPAAPLPLSPQELEVSASEGDTATLQLQFYGNPPPKISWRFGELTIDSNTSRYRLLSDGALQIVPLYRNDTGIYICVAENDKGVTQQTIHLAVSDPVAMPAGIVGDLDALVTGELGRPLYVRCLAYGYPPPTVAWYHGYESVMVPYNDIVYERKGNVLLIRSLALETLGQYNCQAYNGEGKVASWRVLVFIPDGLTTAAITSTTTETPRPLFTVPVTTKVSTRSSTTVNIGSDLQLTCEVDGFPEPDMHWTKDGGTLTQGNPRITITGGTFVSRLTVARVSVANSGLYACHASNRYSSYSDALQINVKKILVPAKCTDNVHFANCYLIVQIHFCKHKYYKKFCCKSCVEAGQLDPQETEV